MECSVSSLKSASRFAPYGGAGQVFAFFIYILVAIRSSVEILAQAAWSFVNISTLLLSDVVEVSCWVLHLLLRLLYYRQYFTGGYGSRHECEQAFAGVSRRSQAFAGVHRRSVMSVACANPTTHIRPGFPLAQGLLGEGRGGGKQAFASVRRRSQTFTGVSRR